jgi:hypothetical protein
MVELCPIVNLSFMQTIFIFILANPLNALAAAIASYSWSLLFQNLTAKGLSPRFKTLIVIKFSNLICFRHHDNKCFENLPTAPQPHARPC